ncbi:pentapeptide repeat-containing protein [Nodosilinea sp. FACHB-131]|uniref:pentapeptide repeat-containing protein n=1 Tax=Cyanophyceae TaxID=3028117 RepID=UPI0016884BE1|nr:pentapeptide repeat-containing protein [Nodosilinea sp. FACHB-131]MBD1877220.1 pentapeptide repeat-containing protein [Nodosilinea sp. FACHB-131]
MANKQHISILNQGVETWNNWRRENPDEIPDVSGWKFIRGKNLSRINLSGANIKGTNFSFTILEGADFREAKTGISLFWSLYFLLLSLLTAIVFSILSILSIYSIIKFTILLYYFNIITIGIFLFILFVYCASSKKGHLNYITKISFLVPLFLFLFLSISPFIISKAVGNDLIAASITLFVFANIISFFNVSITIFLFLINALIGSIPLDEFENRQILDFIFEILKSLICQSATRFYGADLTEADFSFSDLKFSDLRHSILTRTKFINSQNLYWTNNRNPTLKDQIARLLITQQDIKALDKYNEFIYPEIQKNRHFTPDELKNWQKKYDIDFSLDVQYNLTNINLSGAYLRGANLAGAYLEGANLSEADLSGANLSEANLSEANLKKTNLSRASLNRTNFSKANLSDCDLSHADLRSVILNEANLRNAKLREANLFNLRLNFLNISNADLFGSNFARVQALNTNFKDSIFTGTCIQDWNINRYTNLDGIQCEFFYQSYLENDDGKYYFQDRRPINNQAFFISDEFTILMRKSLETIDIIFKDRINWKAFSSSFQELRDQYSDHHIGVQGIEEKGDDFVVRLDIETEASGAELEQLKGEVEAAQQALYYNQSLLMMQQGQIEVYKSNMMEVVKILAATPKVNQNFHGPTGNVAGTNTGSMTASINQNSNDISRLLTALRNAAQQFPEAQKDEALMELDDLESDLNAPEKRKPKRIGKRLQRLLATRTAAATFAGGAAILSGDINEFTGNVLELAERVGLSQDAVQPN